MKKSTAILFSFIIGLAVLFTIGCKGSENDTRMVKLETAIDKMSNNPSESDSTATSIKTILNIASYDGFKTDRFEYYTDTTTTKALVLVRIPELNTVDIEDRKVFMSLINSMSDKESWAGKEKYIGVFGRRNLMLCKTPKVNENKSNLSKKLLLDYYGPKEIIK